MNADCFSVVLVYSTSQAIRLERQLHSQSIPCHLRPVPRHLSSDCGICVLFSDSHRPQVEAVIAETGMDIQGIMAAA